MSDNNLRYRAALRELTTGPVPFVTLGSAGLTLSHPSLDASYALPDADVLVASSADDVLRMARWMATRGWDITVWGAAVGPATRAEDLLGKQYFRATRQGLTLDVIYEAPSLDGPSCVARGQWIDGVPVCPREDLWFSKLVAAYTDCRLFAEAHGLEIPAESLRRAEAPPPTDRRDETRDEHGTDWGMVEKKTPSGVVFPESVTELARVFVWATATRTRAALRGRGRSAAGQCLTDSVAVSTARLDRILSIEGELVTVEAGVRWDHLVSALLAHGRVPPVLTSYLPATVGGTLSTPAFSRGSQHHGLQFEHVESLDVVASDGRAVWCSATREPWLFHAVLGGLGRFGTIARATLRHIAAPVFLGVSRKSYDEVSSLCEAWERAARDPRSYHVTAFPKATGPRWEMVEARVTTADDPSAMAFADYVAPPRPEAPVRSAQWLHVLVPRAGLDALLTRYASELSLVGGDGVQVLPVLKRRDFTASLARMPAVPDGALVAGVCLVREHLGRDPARLDAHTRSLYEFARSLGAKSTLGGTLPAGLDGWREHLGDSTEAVLQTLRRADPRGLLGGVGTQGLTGA